MKRQPNRLPADARHGFGGGAIDRSKPLTFRLDGRRYEAFAGDTVFSALLAAGVDTAGLYHGEPIALEERFAPPVIDAAAKDRSLAMPMDRVPVVPGLRLATLRPRRQLFLPDIGFLTRGNRSLGQRLDDPRLLDGAWLGIEPATSITADTVVVGGGLAGMSAALAAAEAGDRVLLVERRGGLGGDARFFGTVGEEETPEATIARLGERIAAAGITVMLFTDAFVLGGTRVRAHQVDTASGRLVPRVVALEAQRVVLATGAAERLPVFPGNRAPGVAGAVAAFSRAERYGVWPGRRVVFATPHNYTYRLALLAADAGIEVQRVTDARLAPQSRFIDFCKASGITLATGLVTRAAEPAADGLKAAFAASFEGVDTDTAPVATQQLVAAGTFQPRLALWLMAGGRCDYDAENGELAARGDLDGVALAGAAAGFTTTAACVKSGAAAVARLRGKEPTTVEDVLVDAVYESRAALTPVAPPRLTARGAAFLDNGFSFAVRPPRQEAGAMPATQLSALSVSDVAASVEAGLIPAADAGIIAAERCLGGGEIVDSGWRVAPRQRAPDPPPWLGGRFGPKPQVATITANDGRAFEAGCLIYPSSDAADPLAAAGAVLGPAPTGGGTLALLARTALGGPLFVRDTVGAVPVQIVEKPKG